MPEVKFNGHPTFKPHFTPLQMLSGGVYGGNYFYRSDSRKGFHPQLLASLPKEKYMNAEEDAALNKFGVLCPRRNREIPMDIKFISPHGWFQWYFKFYYNQSLQIEDSARVKQWEKEVKTLFTELLKACTTAGTTHDVLTGDTDAVKLWRQSLFEIGWDSTIHINTL